MNISVTGRHMNVSDSTRAYAEKKIKKLDRYFNQLIDAHIVFSVVKLDHFCEVLINGDGIQFHGKEKAADLFSAIDLLHEKMEKQIRRYKEKHQMHKGPEKGELASFDYSDSVGTRVVLRQVSNKPVDSVEAFLQMQVNRRDFILFKKGVSKIEAEKDYGNKNYAMIFRDNGSLKMVELPFDKEGKGLKAGQFIAYELDVFDDSQTSPKIKFKKLGGSDLDAFSLHEAIVEMDKSSRSFMPFFNTDSDYFNIIFRDGDRYEVMVPAF
ncbi:MAG: ribosome-associated translation inhibitor RaiA [Spirochaetes bacterium]|nr:ribosome-associated translation inhibitor RaiA [Spirochaetota bacterium]